MVLVAGTCSCRFSEAESGAKSLPEPKNRKEAAALERKGHNFEVANPPAWVNDPPPPAALPSRWKQVGRKKYLLGRPPRLSEDRDLLSLLQKPRPLGGKVVRVRAKIQKCGDIYIMRPSSKTDSPRLVLMVKLPQEDPAEIQGEAMVEGTLSVEPKQLTHARLSCGAAHHSPALLVADTVITSRKP